MLPIYCLKAQNYEKGQFDYGFTGIQTNFTINYDRSKSEIRSERVKIAIEINKSRKLLIDGKVEFYFGQNPNNLSKSEIGSVTSGDDFNLKTFYFKQDGLVPNTKYYFRWSFVSNSINSGQGIVEIQTPRSFSVLPDQLFDIPETGTKVGDTLGRIKYDDTDNKWKKIQTFYKTSVGLKQDGTLQVWGNNAYSLIPDRSFRNKSVVYEPVTATTVSITIDLDSDNDGYLDRDEDLYVNGEPQSDKNDPNSKPVDSDNNKFFDPNNNNSWYFNWVDGSYTPTGQLTSTIRPIMYSDILELQLGMNPNNMDPGNSDLYQSIRNFRDAPRKIPDTYLDFALTKTSVYAIKENGELWHWGNGSGGNDLWGARSDLNGDLPGGEIDDSMIEKNKQYQFFLEPWNIGSRFNELSKVKVISSSDNFLTPKYPNIFGKENWYDAIVAAINEDGDLFAWGQINGVVINSPLSLGSGRRWKDVKISDGILALSEDGTIHQLAIELYEKVPSATIDTDNDGVPDSQDAFKYNSRYQYDSDDDGLPNKEEILIGTYYVNPNTDWDTDKDGVSDSEDAFPLDSRYDTDEDEDGVPYKLDFKINQNGQKIFTDNNWDRDGDNIPDGQDAEPDVYGQDDWDYDGDGISNVEEWNRHLDAWNEDTDGDGFNDNEDEFPNSYFYHLDSDKDGLPDALEIENETKYLDPDTDWDSDGDGVKDGIDISKFDSFRRKADDLWKNCSGQNWRECNGYEYFWKFWDLKHDCNGDGRVSREEWEKTDLSCNSITLRDDFPTDNNRSLDSDRDGEDDSVDEDDDNDGYKDIFEEFEVVDENGNLLKVGTNPKSWWDSPERAGKDADYDRVPDLVEIYGLTISNTIIYPAGTDPNDVNSDGDWAWDGWDDWPLDPNIQHDKDHDKLEDWVESRLGTLPYLADTDGDGVNDGEDDFPTKNWNTEPGKFSGTKDTDKDGLSDEYEMANSNIYDYTKADTDGDGFWDCECDESKFVYYTDYYGNSYWTDNWRWCNQEKENENLTSSNITSDTLDPELKNKFINAGYKTVREVLDLNDQKIIEIAGFVDQNNNNDSCNNYNSSWDQAWRFRRKLEIYLWGSWSFDINKNEWVNSKRIKEDKFPGDPNESLDFDNDGIGDNSDPDIDDDGFLNEVDDLDFDPTEHLNTDAPTILNGGLKDYNCNGIYGEDADGDGWYEEVDLWNFDYIGNNKDMDDDGDKFLDVDEIASGTDPLDPTSFPGSGFGDTDYDGLSNNYEIANGSDPNDWDSDNDGISDGWRYPHVSNREQNPINWKIIWQFPSYTSTTTTDIGDEFWFRFEPDRMDWITKSLTTTYTMSVPEVMNYFKNEFLNTHIDPTMGMINYKDENNQISSEYFSVTISGTALILEGRNFNINDNTINKDQNFFYRASVVLKSANNKITSIDQGVDTWRVHNWKSDIYDQRRGSRDGIVEKCCANWYGFYKGYLEHDLTISSYFMDQFPNDPDEFWDTDGDGIGDNSDPDIDGDGIDNSVDKSPYDPLGALDTDGDGNPDYKDFDDDDDGYLDIDEIFNNTNTKDSNDRPVADSDNDGFSDAFETSRGSNPNLRDTDGDGVSDGYLFIPPDESTWKVFIQIPSGNLIAKYESVFKLELENLNWGGENWAEKVVSITNSVTTGAQILEEFKNFVNGIGPNNNENFSATVSDTRGTGDLNTLIISGSQGDEHRNIHYKASIFLVENGKLIVGKEFDHDYHQFKGQFLYPRKTNECCWTFAYNGYKQTDWNNSSTVFYDMFPNDANEFWDIDNDGIGDNSDSDIDGDGTLNSIDAAPFDPNDIYDTDGDGVSDSYDPNDDGDNFLDIDDPDPLNYTPTDGGADADGDGFSDTYETNDLKTDPNNWDSDNDGVSDGWKFPRHDYNQNWRFVITTVNSPTSYEVRKGQVFEFRMWDHNNWEAGIDIRVLSEEGDTAYDVLIDLKNEINSHGRIPTNNHGDEIFTASVDGNKLIIQGNDQHRNIGIEGSESVINLEGKVIFTRRSWKWDSINEIFYKPRKQTITEWEYDKYFYRDGQIHWQDAGGQLLIDMFPNNANEFWDTDGDGLGDNTDDDDDDDTLSDAYELTPKGEWRRTSNPLMKDTDGDGLEDNIDPIPFRKEETKDTDGDWLGDEIEDWDDDNDGLDDGFEISTSSVNPDSDGDGYSDGERGLFDQYDSDGNWQTVIKLLPTYTTTPTTGLFERYAINIEGWNNWENKTTIELNTGNTRYSLNELITFFQNEINQKYSTISYTLCCPEIENQIEEISATISGTDLLIIKGFDQQKNLHIWLDWEWNNNYIRALTSEWWYLNKDQFPNDPAEYHDSDRDKLGDNSDPNDDWDSLTDKEELLLGTNPFDGDSDGDWWNDFDDQMPLDPTSRQDSDSDGIPDFRWNDNNGDGRFSLCWGCEDGDPVEVDTDRDGDGILNINENPDNGGTHPDKYDTDDDGYHDGIDLFPFNPNAHSDFDLDGQADVYDMDDDNDGYSDKDEIYSKTNPNDPNDYPSDDTDQDFMSDLFETYSGTRLTEKDSDGDGILDGADAFPTDKYEWIDSDADGTGDFDDDNDDNDEMPDFWEEIGIKYGFYAGHVSTTTWDRYEDLIGAQDEFLKDSDWDQVPDVIEKKAAELFKQMFDNGTDQYKRAVWRSHEGISPWDDRDNDGNYSEIIYSEYNCCDDNGQNYRNEKRDDWDADGDNIDDKVNAIQSIDFEDWDDDGSKNWEDDHTDNNGHDHYDQAPFDQREHRDRDRDFIGDSNDLDRDGDTIENFRESDKGSDENLYDTDRDGVNDAIDFYAHDPRYSVEDEFVNSNKFRLKQIGNSNDWKEISTWNLGQVGSSSAFINNNGELFVLGMNYGSLPFNASKQNQYQGLPLERVYENWNNGISDAFSITTPQKVRGEITWNKISLGKGFGIGTDINNDIYSWGVNLSSQLGIGKPSTFVNFTSPKLYLGDINIISAGDQQVGIINEDGKLRMIGSNDQGQLGTGASPFNYPRELDWSEIEADIEKVKVTFTETHILDSQGYLWAYGDNDFGQLGRGIANTAAENFVAEKVVDQILPTVQISNNWTDIYAYSGQTYAFKSEGNEEYLYAWGNNENYALGVNKNKSDYNNQIPFERNPVKIEGIIKSEILVTENELQFTPINGGFIFIKEINNSGKGELWGVGENFYTGRFNKFKTPSRIGKINDWVKIHDLKGAIKNIILKRADGSTWGAGDNSNFILTNTPCPDPQSAISTIYLTTKRQKQIFEFELSSQFTGTASISLDLGGFELSTSIGSITTSQIGSTTLITRVSTVTTSVMSIVSQFDSQIANNNEITNSFTISKTQLTNGNYRYRFEAINFKNYNPKKSITNKSQIFTGTVTLTKLIKNISGITTFSVIVNGIEISKEIGAENSKNEDQLRSEFYNYVKSELNDKNKFPYPITATAFNDSDDENKYKLKIERTDFQDLNLTVTLKLSGLSSSTIITNEIQKNYGYDDECNNWLSFHNKLVKIFTKEEFDWKKLSVSKNHVVGLTVTGTIYTWGGRNNEGQLGYGSRNSNPTRGVPKLVESISSMSFKDISASEGMSFGITTSGTLYAWGDNDLGSLGDGSNLDAYQPVTVSSTLKFKKILGGHKFQIAVAENNKVYGWGYQKYGDLGALGKVKSDIVSITSDLSETDQIIKTTPDGEYLLMSQMMKNYIDTKLNFEVAYSKGNFGNGSSFKRSNSSKSNLSGKSSKSQVNSSKMMTVGKWKVKKKAPAFKGKSAVSKENQFGGVEMPYNFDLVDVNEKPSNIILSDLNNKLSRKSKETFISSITMEDPDKEYGDILTASIPSNSPNSNRFFIRNEKLYFDSITSKVLVPYEVTIRATDWEGLVLEKVFEILVDDEGQIIIEEVNSEADGVTIYDQRFIDTDGDGFVDADEFLIGTDPFDFRSFPTDIDRDGILDFYDGDIDNDGYLNEDDQFPLNPDEWIDADQDGIGDNLDSDDDNDGIPDIDVNWAENYIIQDLFPNDPNESTDFDRDGIGDNSDPDDDNDGYTDSEDAFPYNPYEWLDSDNDSIGNNEDLDNDNDGFSDFDEIAIGTNPLDPNDFPSDLDGDFVPDVIDFDRDGDGINNDFDNAPDFYNPNQEFVDDENHIKLIFQEFFSPNGDGINDNFEIGEIQRYPNNMIWIYDSVGNLVFESKGYDNSWQGTLNGNPLPKGSYLYRVDADGNGITEYQGWIYLTR